MGDEEIEKLFSSPIKGGRSGSGRGGGHTHVSFKDDEFSNVSVGDASFGMDAMTEESMNLTGGRKDLSFGAPGSSKSGYMGNLWKARYGASKSPMPR